MATINANNNPLSGSTGTGSFVGTDSPVLTGKVDCSTTSCEIPNNSAPTISAAGHIALDNSVSGFKPTITYHNGTDAQALIAVTAANLSTTDGYVVAYDSANSQFKMQAEAAAGGGKSIVQYASAALGADATTTSTSASAVGLSVSITPTSGSNKIVCVISGDGRTVLDRASRVIRYGFLYHIVTVSGTPTTLTTTQLGRNLDGSSGSLAQSFYPFYLYYEQIPGSTTARTYSLSFATGNTACTTQVDAGTFIYVYEIEV